ncbi:uncharacterized protein [Amphiura filiformis]|uniref:uncharacterized protein n=1 Tax=Amphiura filiformis TaxID=82378 RepID=UPI003B21DCDB
MDSTKFTDESESRDTSDTKYLVFTDDTCDDQNKNYTVKSGSDGKMEMTGFCTVQKLGLFAIIQIIILIVVAIIMGMHTKISNKTTIETQALIKELQNRVANNTEDFANVDLSSKSKIVASQSTTSVPLVEDQYKPAGVTYIRWGRTVCPDTADLVYTGIAAGGKGGPGTIEGGTGDNIPGGGSNYLCLTRSPQFNQSESGQQPARARIYGAEYRSGEPGAIHDVHNAPIVGRRT